MTTENQAPEGDAGWLTDALPHLPMHPEPRTQTWTALEARCIERYGADCARAALAAQCLGSDPACPCQDGDACHYQDASDGTKAWPSPAEGDERAAFDKWLDWFYPPGLTQNMRDQGVVAWAAWQARAALSATQPKGTPPSSLTDRQIRDVWRTLSPMPDSAEFVAAVRQLEGLRSITRTAVQSSAPAPDHAAVMRQALEALEWTDGGHKERAAIAALRGALATQAPAVPDGKEPKL